MSLLVEQPVWNSTHYRREDPAMADGLLERPLVPIVDEADAESTYAALLEQTAPEATQPVVIHVRTDTNGQHGAAALERFESLAAADRMALETNTYTGDDITETIIDAATAVEASAIVFCSRGGSGWFDLLAGGVRSSLMAKSQRPVVLLPTDVG